MIANDILDLLQCPSCAGPLASQADVLACDECEVAYPCIDGIWNLVVPKSEPTEVAYQTDTLMDVIAGMYDTLAPAMSLGVWHCSPLRYVDSENRALGRANGGVYVKAPVGTGVVMDRCLADYHDVTVLCLDSSWQMLRKARKRLSEQSQRIIFVRVDYGRLPLRSGVAQSLQSLNGLHGLDYRPEFIGEAKRVTAPAGFISGSALVRGETQTADLVLNRYERMGLFPMLRTAPYLVEELRSSGTHVHHETHGAVLFFDFENN